MAYGFSFGGSFVSLLVSRKNVHINHAIIGSSDMDQTSKLVAKIQTAIIMPIIYPLITGKGSKLAKKFIAKRMNSQDENADYRKKFIFAIKITITIFINKNPLITIKDIDIITMTIFFTNIH